MSDISVEEYKIFIDALVELSKNPSSVIVGMQNRTNIFSEHPNREQQRKEKIIESFSSEQREVLIELLFSERGGVIEELLAFFDWKEYRISHESMPLAIEPFGTELFYDFGGRREGRAWPADDLFPH